MSASKLELLQEEIRQVLDDHEDIPAAVAVLTQKRGNLQKQAENTLAKLGVAILVLPPIGNVQSPEAPGPYLDQVGIQVTISEIVHRNDTGCSALALAEKTLCILHHFQPTTAGVQVLTARPGDNPVPVQHDTYNIADTFFQTRFGLGPDA